MKQKLVDTFVLLRLMLAYHIFPKTAGAMSFCGNRATFAVRTENAEYVFGLRDTTRQTRYSREEIFALALIVRREELKSDYLVPEVAAMPEDKFREMPIVVV
jgi:hypothetical protein